MVEGLQDVEAGNVITITLALDLTAYCRFLRWKKPAGWKSPLPFKTRCPVLSMKRWIQPSSALISYSVKETMAVLFTPSRQADKPEVVEARKLVARAEALFDKTSNEDKEDMIDLIEDIHTCIAEGYSDRLKETAAKLADIIYYLES